VLEQSSQMQKEKAAGQISFFDQPAGTAGFQRKAESIPEVKEWPEPQLLAFEKDLLGFYVSGHPLARYAKQLQRFTSCSISSLPKLKDEETVKIVGLITKVKNTITRKKQEKMAILLIEDLDAVIEVLVFPATYQKVSRYIQSGTVVMLRGRLDIKESSPKIIAEDLFPFDEVYKLVKGLKIDLAGIKENIFESLKKLLSASSGSVPVYLHLDSASKTRVQVIVGQELFVTVTDQLIQDIENLVGEHHGASRGESRVSLIV